MVFCRAMAMSYHFGNLSWRAPVASFSAMAWVRDICASRSKTRTFAPENDDTTSPRHQVTVVLPTPPLKLIVAMVLGPRSLMAPPAQVRSPNYKLDFTFAI